MLNSNFLLTLTQVWHSSQTEGPGNWRRGPASPGPRALSSWSWYPAPPSLCSSSLGCDSSGIFSGNTPIKTDMKDWRIHGEWWSSLSFTSKWEMSEHWEWPKFWNWITNNSRHSTVGRTHTVRTTVRLVSVGTGMYSSNRPLLDDKIGLEGSWRDQLSVQTNASSSDVSEPLLGTGKLNCLTFVYHLSLFLLLLWSPDPQWTRARNQLDKYLVNLKYFFKS